MALPVFLVSLPRSGSTLLQRMLASFPEVASAAEPWIMLPFWGMRDAHAGRAIYFHQTCANAVNDFVDNLTDGESAYAKAVGLFGLTLYAAAAKGKPIFLDKTPRYYLILPLLRRAFPNAKFLLLVRNPLAVLSSIAITFNRGRFRWFEYWIDWIDGHRLMAEAVRSPDENTRIVHYESLVTNPGTELPALCRWLGIDYSQEYLDRYRKADLRGRMGDPTGVHHYDTVSAESVDKWQRFFHSRYRRRAAERMLEKIAPSDLETLGYAKSRLIEQLHQTVPNGGLDLTSRLDAAVGTLAHILDFRYFQARYRASRDSRDYAYGYYRKR